MCHVCGPKSHLYVIELIGTSLPTLLFTPSPNYTSTIGLTWPETSLPFPSQPSPLHPTPLSHQHPIADIYHFLTIPQNTSGRPLVSLSFSNPSPHQQFYISFVLTLPQVLLTCKIFWLLSFHFGINYTNAVVVSQ